MAEDIIKMEEVNSSNLAARGYDPDRRVCLIAFHNGVTYQYGNFPPELYKAFKTAKSAGEFHAKYIKSNKSLTCNKI